MGVTQIQDFSAPFNTGSWVATVVLPWEKMCIPSFLTFVQMYRNQGDLDSPPYLFFIRKKNTNTISPFIRANTFFKKAWTSGLQWLNEVIHVFHKHNRLKEAECLYERLLISEQYKWLLSATSDDNWIRSLDKLWKIASSDWISVGKSLIAQLSEGKHGSIDCRYEHQVPIVLSPPERYITSRQRLIGSKFQYDFKVF